MRHLKLALAVGALVVVAFAYRYAFWENADALNSDHAVVGLQAVKIFQGEWSMFLWGVGYQASFEPLLAGVAFKLFGYGYQSLMGVAFLGFTLVIALVCLTLSRHVGIWVAFLTTLPIVLTTYSVSNVTLYPPRIWCLSAVFAGVWALDRVPMSRCPRLSLFAGVILVFFSLYIDFYSIQFLPAALILAGLSLRAMVATDIRNSAKKVLVSAVLLGGSFLLLTRFMGPTGGVPLAFSPKTFLHNIPLLLNTCWPTLFAVPSIEAWPASFKLLHLVAIVLYVAANGLSGWVVFQGRSSDSARRLGVFGLVATATSLCGFLGSSMSSDSHSARYLAVMIWSFPFVLVPLAYRINQKVYSGLMVLYLVPMMAAGWLSASAAIPHLGNEGEVRDYLRSEGVRYAKAPYWLSYRLSFLFEENPTVIPVNEWEDRYFPYRHAANQEKRMAEITHSEMAGRSLQDILKECEVLHRNCETKRIGKFMIVIYPQTPSL